MSHDPVDIVIADDNAVLLSVLAESLKECGYSVRTAVDGLGALTEIRNLAPDILLSDLNMPKMSGFELISIVHRDYPRIKVIAMSGSYSGTIVPEGLAADAFYEKSGAGIVRLLQIINAIKDEPELPPVKWSMGNAAPVGLGF
jgi:CheY-like chemotaxis protein